MRMNKDNVFSTWDYGPRARGSYDRDMIVEGWNDGKVHIDVGGEYCFTFDKDIVKDLIKVLQKCLEE